MTRKMSSEFTLHSPKLKYGVRGQLAGYCESTGRRKEELLKKKPPSPGRDSLSLCLSPSLTSLYLHTYIYTHAHTYKVFFLKKQGIEKSLNRTDGNTV
jgi:hypothetical protein